MRPEADARAVAATLLSHWWSRPTDGERALWSENLPAAEIVAEELGCDAGLVRSLADALARVDGEAILEAHERLLVGPGRPPCAPYESLWRGDVPRHEQGVLMGATADSVTDIYRELGLAVRDDAHELPDHLLVEWEAVAYALDHAAEDAAARLLDEHLAQWMPSFCRAVGESDEPFYDALAAVTRQWTEALSG